MRDPVTLTPEISAMLDRHEQDKAKKAKLLTEHLTRQRMLPSTEEEPHHHLERKAKIEADKLLAATEAERAKQDRTRQAKEVRHGQNTSVIATFAKRAKEATITSGAIA